MSSIVENSSDIERQLIASCDVMCTTSSLYINTNTPADISYSPRGLGLAVPALAPEIFLSFLKHFQADKDFILIYSSIQRWLGTVRLEEECNISTSIIVFSRDILTFANMLLAGFEGSP